MCSKNILLSFLQLPVILKTVFMQWRGKRGGGEGRGEVEMEGGGEGRGEVEMEEGRWRGRRGGGELDFRATKSDLLLPIAYPIEP